MPALGSGETWTYTDTGSHPMEQQAAPVNLRHFMRRAGHVKLYLIPSESSLHPQVSHGFAWSHVPSYDVQAGGIQS